MDIPANTIPPLDLLYQDQFLVIANKPTGLLVHKSDLDKYETECLEERLSIQLGCKLFTIHRLDKPTSGAVTMAKDKETAAHLSQQFANGEVEKQYLALVRGFVKEAGTVDYALKDLYEKNYRKAPTSVKPPKEAVTNYHPLKRYELPFAVGRYPTARYTLLGAKPLTGRFRQIRRHMKHIFHPIVGDTSHGDGKHNSFFREQFGCFRLMLHAQKVAFTHPINKMPLVIEAPPPASFAGLVERLEKYRTA